MSLIWIVDDEPVICSTLERAFTGQGHRVRVFQAAEPAIEAVSEIDFGSDPKPRPDLIIMDVRLPGIDGLSAIDRLHPDLPHTPFILITAFGDLPTAVRAMEAKVFEYLTKPFDLDMAMRAVARGLAVAASTSMDDSSLSTAMDRNAATISESELFGSSPAMQSVFKRIALAAMSDCPVLIRGESGTGKELVARAIHRHSPRHLEPYLAIAPVTMNPTLIESELFGHERGAFTGADQARRGAFELAGQGTILLDEIGDLPLAQQVKLLRVLEQREYFPVGSSKPKEVKARVIAASHRDLLQLVESTTFREDLYFRLAVLTIELPALRDRTEDIVPLALRFLQRHGYEAVASIFADDVVPMLLAYAWPGNVRELRNAMEHAAVLARGNRIHVEHLPQPLASASTAVRGAVGKVLLAAQLDQLIRHWVEYRSASRLPSNAQTLLSEMEADDSMNASNHPSLYDEFLGAVEPPLLRALLEFHQGNRAAVAHHLGLHRSTLRQKMRHYQLES